MKTSALVIDRGGDMMLWTHRGVSGNTYQIAISVYVI